MIHHCRVGSRIQAIPPEKIRGLGIPAPLLVFQKLLPHEELGNARSGEQNPHRETRPAARVPRPPVGRVGKVWDSLVGSYLDDVMILNAGNGLPGMAEALRIESTSDAVEIDSGMLTGCR